MQRYFGYYAGRIREIYALNMSMSSIETQFFSPETWQALELVTDHKLGALSPNLRTCSFQPGGGGGFPPTLYGMHLFLGPHLETLDMEDLDLEDVLLYGSLHQVRDSMKFVRDLRLDGRWISQGIGMTGLCAAIISNPWQCLEVLSLPLKTHSLMTHLATLPRLRRLEFTGPFPLQTGHDAPSKTVSPSHESFPSLQSIGILGADNLADLEDVLRYLPPNNAVERLACVVVGCPTAEEYQRTLQTIAERGNPSTLRTIYIKQGHDWKSEAQLDLAMGASSLIDIAPLYIFTQLRELEIYWEMEVKNLSNITVAWPHIERLYLCNTASSEGRMPCINHRHIVEILRDCRSLVSLGLRFDTTHITGEELTPATPSRLQHLHVGDSPIVSPSLVIKFLKAQCPGLQSIAASFLGDADDIRCKRWIVVHDTVRNPKRKGHFAAM